MKLLNRVVPVILALKFSTTGIMCKISPKNAKSASSQQWLSRKLNDPYTELAKRNNYRSRSAFKLLEIEAKYQLLKPGQCVIDCGACPGSWTQVAVNKTNANGHDLKRPVGFVISIDKLPIYPVEGATILGNLDFTTPDATTIINQTLKGRNVDVFLSDMAPNAMGIKSVDHDRIVNLAESALSFAVQVSTVGASLVIKLWDGGSTQELFKNIRIYYNTVHHFRPKATQKESSELFIVGKDFKGLIT